MKSSKISIISLIYENNEIIIESICPSNHKIKLQLDEFLIKFHPLYEKLKYLHFCNKCFLKLFHYKKSSTFFTHYCNICDKYLCLHKECKIEHKDNKKIIEKEIPIIDFIFPICPFCEDDNIFDLNLGNVTIEKNILNNVLSEYKIFIEIFNEFEKNFKNLEGKFYFQLYPYFEKFMKKYFLEILLCENLFNTYKFFKERNKMLYSIIFNISNIIDYNDFLLLEKDNFINLENIFNEFQYYRYNIFNNEKLNINEIEIYLKQKDYYLKSKYELTHFFFYMNKNNLYKIEKSKYKQSTIYSPNFILFFPEINIGIENIDSDSLIYYLQKPNKYKSIKLCSENLSYIQNNLFIELNQNKLFIQYLKPNELEFITKSSIKLEKPKNYNKILTGSKNIFFCLKVTLSEKYQNFNDPFIFDTDIFDYNFESDNYDVDILKYSEELKEAKIILHFKNINIIKKLNKNLFLFVQDNILYFRDGEAELIKQLNLNLYDIKITNNNNCIYNKKYLVIFNEKELILIDLEILEVKKKINIKKLFGKVYSDKSQYIKNTNIIDDKGNDIKLIYPEKIKFNKIYEKEILCTSRNNELFVIINCQLFVMKDIEIYEEIFVQLLDISKRKANKIFIHPNENIITVINQNVFYFYQYDI